MTPAIAILGAGPAGLALGRMLEVANLDYIIFERDQSEASAFGRGGTLDLHTRTGQLALQKGGLLDQFKAIARYETATTIVGADGTVHLRSQESGDNDKPEIDRWDLRGILLRSVPAYKVRWNARVQHVQRDVDGSMSIRFTDGKIESGFRLVVGADGAWSKARSLVSSSVPQYCGMTYFTTTIKPDNPFHTTTASLVGKGNYLAFGDERQIYAHVLGDGSYSISIGLRLPEDWTSENATLLKDGTALRHLLLQEYFSDWPLLHTNLIKNSEGSFRAWPIYALPQESLSWETVPGVALIGDAAHLVGPFSGGGVNIALYDSVQLAEQIVKHGLDNLDRAVAEYEKEMLPRAMKLARKSANSGELMFASDAPQGWLDALMNGKI